MSAPSVLYDAPGPKAKVRNLLYTVLFVVVFVGVIWWFLGELDKQHQLDWPRWKPYLADTFAWTDFLLPGLLNTLIAAGLSLVIALPIGAILGIARLSDHAWLRVPASVVVEFFRATPVLILMLFANIAYNEYTDVGSEERLLYAVVTALVLYNGSVLAEVVRAGILSLAKGQTEAAQALGMRKGQLMTNVLLPQAVTAMLPTIVSQLVVIVKDTAIGGAIIGYGELVAQARPLNTTKDHPSVIATLVVIAVIFIVLNFVLTSFAGWLEKYLRTRTKGSRAVLTADMVEEQAPGMHIEDAEVRGPKKE